jgi:hypothetical protein
MQVIEVRLEATQGELTEARAEIVSREAMLEEIRRRAGYLAQQLELAELRCAGLASQRYVPEGQGLLPFDVDIVPPPRAPVPEPQSDEEATEPPQQRAGGKPRRRNRDDFAHLPGRPVHCPFAHPLRTAFAQPFAHPTDRASTRPGRGAGQGRRACGPDAGGSHTLTRNRRLPVGIPAALEPWRPRPTRRTPGVNERWET